MDSLIDRVTSYVQEFMDKFDPSHDYKHIQRVLELAKIIEARENSSGSTVHYNSDVITLASLLHDVGDHKYLSVGEDGETMVERLLIRLKANEALALEVQAIVNHILQRGQGSSQGPGFPHQAPRISYSPGCRSLRCYRRFWDCKIFCVSRKKGGYLGRCNDLLPREA